MPCDFERALLLGALLIPAAAGSARSASNAFVWPDPQTNGIVLVNANQNIASYVRRHPDWFSQGELVLDLSISNRPDDPAAAERERSGIQQLLTSRGMTVGTYISGTTVAPRADIRYLPYDKVPAEWMPEGFAAAGSWPGEPQRKIIDVTDARTRRALHDGIRRLWRQSDACLRFVDNAASHSSTGGKQPWAAQCANIREIRRLGESLGCRLVFNVSVQPALLSDSGAGQLAKAIGRGNGILLEDPWGEATRKSPALTRQAQAFYRRLLDQGIAVIMLPVKISTGTLLGWVGTWRLPTDRLYLGWSFWKQPWDGKRPWERTAQHAGQ